MFLQLVVSGLAGGAVYSIVGLALVVIYKATNVMNFAQGEMAMFSTFITYVLITDAGLPYGVAVVLTLAISAVAGVTLERFIVRPAASTSLLTVAVLTMGMFYIINFFTLRVFPFGSIPRRFPSLFPRSTVSVGNAVLSIQKLGTFCAGLVLVLALGAFYRYTKFGIAMRASADNSEAASLMGVNLNRVASVSWALAAMLGAIAGILVAPFLFLDVLFMKFTLIKSLCAAVMGGFTSLPGVVLGGLLVGLAENLFGGYVSTDFKNSFVFSLILIVLFLRPQGLMRRARVIKV